MTHPISPIRSTQPAHRLPPHHNARTEQGDDLMVFASPAHWNGAVAPSVTLSVNLHAAALTAAEARQLARVLLHHANKLDEAQS